MTQSQVKIATGNALTGLFSAPDDDCHRHRAEHRDQQLRGAGGGVGRIGLGLLQRHPVCRRGPDGTTWTTPQVLEAVGSGSELDFGNVALAESGRAFAYWSVHVGPGAYTATGASAGADGVWTRF